MTQDEPTAKSWQAVAGFPIGKKKPPSPSHLGPGDDGER